MKTPLFSFALSLLIGSAVLAQQPTKKNKSTSKAGGTMSQMDAKRSSQSESNAHDGLPAGTGTTMEQTQAAKMPTQPTTTDARSSTMTGPTSVKARMKNVKGGN
ncbi:hypothetical protein CLV58_119100 [Spirosoma oryzae]|uniref:Pentapeptide MXKDX repeat protein n=1 Tax=Spirosoma oryzae TaxID=1469603 RepID=A0A2T0SKL6_9BACT|nr:hypothetical protein [Spirosoma oryzae]PRY33950.1 hypothetical protein CLV58_119100 [Spirosoma oryzae]